MQVQGVDDSKARHVKQSDCDMIRIHIVLIDREIIHHLLRSEAKTYILYTHNVFSSSV